MDKLLKIIKNKWFLLAVSFLPLLFVLFLFKMISLTFCNYIIIDNFNSWYALYLLICFLYGVLAFFTRKQIPMIICSVIVPAEALVLMITAFGMWYMIIPPIVAGAFAFLACRSGETFKTIVGTMFLVLFVVGALVYSVFLNLGITLRFVVTDYIMDDGMEIDLDERSSDYLMSPDGAYRLVKYIDLDDDRTTVSYYVEQAYLDEKLPFMTCERVYGCRKVLTTIKGDRIHPEWRSDTVLYIDGKEKDIDELFSGNSSESAEETDSPEASDDED